MPLPLSEIFPDEDYRFQLTLRRGDLAEFFAPSSPALLIERQHWLERDPQRYTGGTDDAALLLDEFEELVQRWSGQFRAATDRSPPLDRLVKLGSNLEPDFVLLSNDGAGVFRVRAGALCFPSWWDLNEKLGLTLDETHSAVPDLNPALAQTISRFLTKLKPGISYERANWGLAATPELNLHPALARPRLGPPLDLERIWVRIEDQILGVLPRSNGIVFGIRLRIFPLRELLGEPLLRSGLHRALATMPTALARYKGIGPIYSELLAATQIN